MNLVHHRDSSNVVPFRGRGVRAQLREALEARVPVRIARERIHPGWIHGFAIAASAEFCLIAEVSDAMRFDGYVVVMISDISGVEEDPGREFVERALALHNEHVVVPADLALDGWLGIAQSLHAHAPILALNMLDEEAGEVSYIGRITGVQSDALLLQEVDPNARWYPDTGIYEIDGIGSIGFGTAYMQALASIAGAPPEPLPPAVDPAP